MFTRPGKFGIKLEKPMARIINHLDDNGGDPNDWNTYVMRILIPKKGPHVDTVYPYKQPPNRQI